MAIETLREIPHELPPAKLYLDDIAEITSVFERFRDRTGNATSDTKYIVNSRFSCTSLADLRNVRSVGDKAYTFRIEVGSCSLQINRFLTFWLVFADPGTREAIYGRLTAIFDERRMPVKATLRAIPWWLGWPLSNVLLVGLAFGIYKFHLSNGEKWILIAVCLFAVIAFGYKMFFQHTVVCFRNSHELEPLSEKWHRLMPYFIGGLIGTLGGVFGKLIGEHIVRFFQH